MGFFHIFHLPKVSTEYPDLFGSVTPAIIACCINLSRARHDGQQAAKKTGRAKTLKMTLSDSEAVS